MNDLEVCKRIAEIEGVEVFNTYSRVFNKRKLIGLYMDTGVKWHHAGESEEDFFTKVYSLPSNYLKAEYSPLTDKALCFDLMVKYDVNFYKVKCSDGEFYQALIDLPVGHSSSQNKDLQRAILLAIIESNK